jgi:hypothetical protein
VLSNLPEVSAHPRCYGASMGFRKELLCGSCVIHMELMCDTSNNNIAQEALTVKFISYLLASQKQIIVASSTAST